MKNHTNACAVTSGECTCTTEDLQKEVDRLQREAEICNQLVTAMKHRGTALYFAGCFVGIVITYIVDAIGRLL